VEACPCYGKVPTYYEVGGMTEVAREERKINPLTATENSSVIGSRLRFSKITMRQQFYQRRLQ
jgi:hypothetical protein